MADTNDITQLLNEWREGSEVAKEKLFQLMYYQLRGLAHEQRQRLGGKHTLNSTGLVHELYLKLAKQSGIHAKDKGHFTLIAGKAMRHILVDYAKMRKRKKRGGEVVKISLEENKVEVRGEETNVQDIIDIDSVLSKLSVESERLAVVVELHFFGGFKFDEIAHALGLNKRTVIRDWKKAKAWLSLEMRND